MRVRRLDLLRYGHFTGRMLEFPDSDHDFHIVLGVNEAGKSTSRIALEDALFGIPLRSTFDFVHTYRDMLVGAVLERPDSVLEFRRRKGQSNTLLDANDQPMAPDALAPFLRTADREFLERMFSLSHERLRRGGQELSDPESEAGATLFGAATGIEEFARHVRHLREEAGELFTPIRSAKRPFYRLIDRLDEATSRLREATVTGDDWQRVREECDRAEAALEKLRQERTDLRRRSARFRRIQLVYPDVVRKQELLFDLAELGEALPFPENVQEQLNEARSEVARHAGQIDELERQVKEEEEAGKEISVDESLLLRADEIEFLDERRIQLQPEWEDLPKRRRDLQEVEKRLRNWATELGLGDSDGGEPAWRVPGRSHVNRIRRLHTEWVELTHRAATAAEHLEKAAERTRTVLGRCERIGPPDDVDRLSAAVKSTDTQPDPGSALAAGEREHHELRAAAEALIRPLLSVVPDENALANLWLPPQDRIQETRDALKNAGDRLKECRDRLFRVERDLLERHRAIEEIIKADHVVTQDEIERLRETRDHQWTVVRRRYVEGTGEPNVTIKEGSEDPVTALTASILEADEAADRRFANAETVARMTEIERSKRGLEDERSSRQAELDDLSHQSGKLEKQWQDMWSNLPGEPLEPDAMMKWVADHERAMKAREARDSAARNIERLKQAEAGARDLLIAETAVLGMTKEGLEGKPFHVVRSLVTEFHGALREKNQKRTSFREDLEEARNEEEARRSAKTRLQGQAETWSQAWHAETGDSGLPALGDPGNAADILGIIEEMRGDMGRAKELRDQRIAKIERDLEDFASRVHRLGDAVAPDLAGNKADDMAVELVRRLKEGQRKQERLERITASISSKNRELEKRKEARRQAQETIDDLMTLAGVNSIAGLRNEIERSDLVRQKKKAVSQLTVSLAQNGGGLPESALEKECEGVDLDQLRAEATETEDRHHGLDGSIEEARLRLQDAETTLDSIGGGDAAISAAWDRQAALSELEQLSTRYVRAQTGSRLLQWAVDRYRAEQQAPLLEKSGIHFATLTRASFTGLKIRYDEKDRALLAGTRPDGAEVDVANMSDGTADQLYLALRIAAIDGWLEGKSALPFVADDLFVNFDDDRTVAGLKVLHRLAGKCQVLVFTHHAHLVDLARSALGNGVSIIELEGSASP